MQRAAVSIPAALSTHDIWKLGTQTTAGRLQERAAQGDGKRELSLAHPRPHLQQQQVVQDSWTDLSDFSLEVYSAHNIF